MDAIGTGEGAQAYGHGLYMADSKDVARQYRDTLSLNGYQDNNANYSKALELGLSAGEFDRLEGMVRMAATKDGLETGRISKDLQEYLQWPDDSMPALESFVGEYLDTLPKGALYRTEIDVTPDQLLDYDKPLSEQSETVRNGVNSTEYYQNLRSNMLERSDDYVDSVDNILSGSTYSELMDHSSNYGKENPSLFSSQLSENNVKGIKYLDGDSRGKFTGRTMRDGKPYSDDVTFPDERSRNEWKAEKEAEGFDVELDEGSSNYVIFDDKLINIAERGAATPGMMALLGAGGAGATAAGSESNAVTEATSRIVNHMLDNVTEVTDLLEIPQRGIQGLLRAGYGLMQGDGLDASLNAGADVVNQGVEETAKQAGDAMLEKTGSPELATMAYTAVMLGSPI